MALREDDGPVWPERLSEIDSQVDDILLPDVDRDDVEQDAEWCEVVVRGEKRRVRFHDYHELYEVPGLYEELFYDRLKCCSPSRVVRLLQDLISDYDDEPSDLRVLDLGAGNGMVGDELNARGADTIVGIDCIPEAKQAAERDRSGVYEHYYVADLMNLSETLERKLRAMKLNCLTSVAALGFGDIPAGAFLQGLDLIETSGWVALTLKEDFLSESDTTGFCRCVRRLNREQILQTHAYRRYRHRLSMTGKPLYYVAMVARKLCPVPEHMLRRELEPVEA